MSIASKMLIFVLVILLALIIGGILLQRFLSRRKSRWPGLVLPFMTFVYAFLMVYQKCTWDLGDLSIVAVFSAWLVLNIPTVVLLAIYWAIREKRRIQEQLDKMNIDDL